MSEPEQTFYDAPNQQAVGLDPPWVEGTGGTPGEIAPADTGPSLEMTKAQLLEYAAEHGVTSVDDSMTKADILTEIEAAG